MSRRRFADYAGRVDSPPEVAMLSLPKWLEFVLSSLATTGAVAHLALTAIEVWAQFRH